MIQKLSRNELDRYRVTASFPEYAEIADMRKGDGGKIMVTEAGVSRQSVKNRLRATAVAYSMQIKFLRSKADAVVFEVVNR